MKKWRCSICGYIHEGNEPPEKCPVCGASKEMFKPYTEANESAVPATGPDVTEADIVVVGGGAAALGAACCPITGQKCSAAAPPAYQFEFGSTWPEVAEEQPEGGTSKVPPFCVPTWIAGTR